MYLQVLFVSSNRKRSRIGICCKLLMTSLVLAFTLTVCNCDSLTADETVEDSRPVEDARPNILWLSTEDIGPQLGCYGDPDAVTPTLDAFAKKSLMYKYAWSNYPVCAPARTTIIAGMYAAANASGNMRSETYMPKGVEMFPHYLREAGYYCVNKSKEDYNYFKTEAKPWDESSGKAHYRNRKDGQPFFAVFNYTGTHESKIRKRPHKQVIDPATVHLTKYWPDTPEVRQDWAQYHDNITVMDQWVEKQLKALKKSGLADNTIVVFFGDHGSGMPRHKRFAGDSGMRVPFIVHVPEKLKELAGKDYGAGVASDRPVGFIDLAPTMLSIAGIKPPEYMQGHAFMGKFENEAPKYLYGFRDRMDERPDVSRSIRDERFLYVRNYMPHIPAGQYVQYQHETPTTSVWKKMFVENKLTEIQQQFWKPHPAEELYDLQADPEETNNLVSSAEFVSTLERFRKEHRASYQKFGDLGLIPEPMAFEFGKDGKSRREMLQDKENFPLDEIFEVANLAADVSDKGLDRLKSASQHKSASIRYWSALGILVDGEQGFKNLRDEAIKLAADSNPAVAVVACEVVAKFGTDAQKQNSLNELVRFSNMKETNPITAVHALNAIDRLDELASSIHDRLISLPKKSAITNRGGNYVSPILDAIEQQK